jgi:Holliday junction DNA helicase RuvB
MVSEPAAGVFSKPASPEETEFDRALRPRSFEEFVGQESVKQNLSVAIQAARGRGEPLDHVLFCGPPGLGKTTLASLIAAEMGTALTVTSGPALAAPKDLMGVLTRLERGDALFVDEVHRLPRIVEEYLYAAMEDHAIDVTLEQGPMSRSVRVPLAPFTLVGATTREGLLSSPFRGRFGLIERLDPYPAADLELIVLRAARLLKAPIEAGACALVADRSRGVPRVALRIHRRLRDLAQVAGRATIDREIAVEGLARLGVDHLGLEEMDRKILRILARAQGAAIGLKTLAAAVEEAEDTIEEVFEPFLIRCGLVERTPRGRRATPAAFTHLGERAPRAETLLPFGTAPAGD